MNETKFEFLERVVGKNPAAFDILSDIKELLFVLGKYVHYEKVSDNEAVQVSMVLDKIDWKFTCEI